MEYRFKGVNSKGKTVRGKIKAENQWTFLQALKADNIFCIDYEEVHEVKIFNSMRKKISQKTISLFCKSMKNNLKAGISLTIALDLVISQIKNKTLAAVLENVIICIKKGDSFSEALNKYRNIFSEYFINMIYIGEESGRLQEILGFLEKYYIKEYKRKKKIVNMSIYPMVLMATTMVIGIVMIVKILPTFLNSINQENYKLPFITKFYMGISKGISSLGIFIIPISIALIVSVYALHSNLKKKGLIDKFLYKSPLIKEFQMKKFCCRFTLSLSMMISSGVDLKSSLVILKSCEGIYIRKQLSKCIGALEKGNGLHEGLKEANIFSDYFLTMIHVGEENGSLEEMITTCNEIFEDELEINMERIMALTEPLLIIFIGIFIGSIVFAIMIPIFSVYNVSY